MISRTQARDSKNEARSTLVDLGFTVVSVGLTKSHENWIIVAGVLQPPERDVVRNLRVNNVPVQVVQETRPRLHSKVSQHS